MAVKTINKTVIISNNRATTSVPATGRMSVDEYPNYYVSELTLKLNISGSTSYNTGRVYVELADGTESLIGGISVGGGEQNEITVTKTYSLSPTSIGLQLATIGFAATDTIQVKATNGVIVVKTIYATIKYDYGYREWKTAPVLSLKTGYDTSNSTTLTWTKPTQTNTNYTTLPIQNYSIYARPRGSLSPQFTLLDTVTSLSYTDSRPNANIPNTIGSNAIEYYIIAYPKVYLDGSTFKSDSIDNAESNTVIATKQVTNGSISKFQIANNVTSLYFNSVYTLSWQINSGINNPFSSCTITYRKADNSIYRTDGPYTSNNSSISITFNDTSASAIKSIEISASFAKGGQPVTKSITGLNVITYTNVTNPSNIKVENRAASILIPRPITGYDNCITLSWAAGSNGTANAISYYDIKVIGYDNNGNIVDTSITSSKTTSYDVHLNRISLLSDTDVVKIKFAVRSHPQIEGYGPIDWVNSPDIVIEDVNKYNINIKKYFSNNNLINNQLIYSIQYQNENADTLGYRITSKMDIIEPVLTDSDNVQPVTLHYSFTIQYSCWYIVNNEKVYFTNTIIGREATNLIYIKDTHSYFNELSFTANDLLSDVINTENSQNIVTCLYMSDFYVKVSHPSNGAIGDDFGYSLIANVNETQYVLKLQQLVPTTQETNPSIIYDFVSTRSNIDEDLLSLLKANVITFQLYATSNNLLFDTGKALDLYQIPMPSISTASISNGILTISAGNVIYNNTLDHGVNIPYTVVYNIKIPQVAAESTDYQYANILPDSPEQEVNFTGSQAMINIVDQYKYIMSQLLNTTSVSYFSVPFKLELYMYPLNFSNIPDYQTQSFEIESDDLRTTLINDATVASSDLSSSSLPINENQAITINNVYFYSLGQQLQYNINTSRLTVLSLGHGLLTSSTYNSFTDIPVLSDSNKENELFTYQVGKTFPALVKDENDSFNIDDDGIIIEAKSLPQIIVLRYKREENIAFNLTVQENGDNMQLEGIINIPELASGGAYYNENIKNYNIDKVRVRYKFPTSENYKQLTELTGTSLQRSNGFITINVNIPSTIAAQVFKVYFEFTYYNNTDSFIQEVLQPFFRIDNDLSIRRNRIGINVLSSFEPGASADYIWNNNSTIEINPHPIATGNTNAVIDVILGDYNKFVDFKLTADGATVGSISADNNKLTISGLNGDALFKLAPIIIEDDTTGTEETLDHYKIAGLNIYQGTTDALADYNFVKNVDDPIVYLQADYVLGGVFNDYAEFRMTSDEKEAGRCVIEVGDGTLERSYARLQPGANIISDTYGFAIGQTENNRTPVAVAGRVLAYPYEKIYDFLPGDAVCSGPNGTVSRMTREEIIQFPERIIGTVSEIPTYDTWGQNNISINGRIWIKIK